VIYVSVSLVSLVRAFNTLKIISMQNNGLIKLFAFLFGIVSIYQLSFTFIANNQEAKAAAYAERTITEDQADFIALREVVEAQYLQCDSSNLCSRYLKRTRRLH